MIGVFIVLLMLLPGGSSSTVTTPTDPGTGPGAPTSGAGSTTAPTPPASVPTKFSDCANGNWRSYTINNLKFKNQGDCDLYVVVNSVF